MKVKLLQTAQALLLLTSITLTAQDGVLDTTFGVNGVAKSSVNNIYEEFWAMTIQPDGKIIAVGCNATGTDANKQSILVRFNVNGSLDSTFGTNGMIVAAYSTQYDQLSAVKIQPDGKIVVAGYVGTDALIARYTASGQLDTTFGTNGVVITNFYTSVVGSTQDRYNCIAFQPDGKILAGGWSKYYSNYPYAIVRYNADGTLDNNFGIGGKTIIGHNWNLTIPEKEVYDLAVTPEGKIYAVGKTKETEGGHFNQTIARFNSDGSMDQTFGINGRRYFDLNNDSSFKELKFQPDGKLVIAGNISVAMTLVRTNDNGVPDTSFSSDGRVSTNLIPTLGITAAFAKSVSVQADGKIIMSGNGNGTAGAQSIVIRYLPDGTPDPAFANNGVLSFLVGDSYQGGSFSAFQPSGKLVVGGDFNDSTVANTDYFLFRISAGELSTDDFAAADIISYPNPVKDKLYIHTEGRNATYRLFSLDGKEVMTAQGPDSGTIQMNMSHLRHGVYILSAEENHTRKITKIIKE